MVIPIRWFEVGNSENASTRTGSTDAGTVRLFAHR
jgi:hypothetical protein